MADLAGLFDGTRSHYAYQVEGLHEVLLEQFGDEYLEEQDEVEFLISEEEPRTLAEIVEAEQEFFEQGLVRTEHRLRRRQARTSRRHPHGNDGEP